jgi:Ribosomal protein L19
MQVSGAVSLYNRFAVGDILGVSFYFKGLSYFFEGICIAIKGKNFVNPETSFILRNVLGDVGVELSCAFFYHRAFSFKFSSFSEKSAVVSRSKWYFIRHRLGRDQRVV